MAGEAILIKEGGVQPLMLGLAGCRAAGVSDEQGESIFMIELPKLPVLQGIISGPRLPDKTVTSVRRLAEDVEV
jgi:hypothetical protein